MSLVFVVFAVRASRINQAHINVRNQFDVFSCGTHLGETFSSLA